MKVPHLLMSTAEDGKQVPWVQPHEPPVGDIHSGYWELAKDGMYGVANRPNGTAHKIFCQRTVQKLRRNPVPLRSSV